MLSATKARAFCALVRIDAKDVLRDKLTGFSTLTFAVVILAIHTSMWLAFAVAGERPNLDPSALAEAPTSELRAALSDFTGVDPEDKSVARAPNTTIEYLGAEMVVTVESHVGWDPLWQAIRATGVPAGVIDVRDSVGDPRPDFLRLNLGTALLTTIAAVAIIGTTVPLVAARGRGFLRLLGTTPLPRGLFIMSKIPVRVALVGLAFVSVSWIGLARRYTEVAALPRLACTTIAAAVMLFGAAAWLGSRGRNAEVAQQMGTFIVLALTFSAGAMLPLPLAPHPVRVALGFTPGAWVTEAAGADLAGVPSLLPVPAYWVLMLVVGATCFYLAARTFRWDGAVGRPTQTTGRGEEQRK